MVAAVLRVRPRGDALHVSVKPPARWTSVHTRCACYRPGGLCCGTRQETGNADTPKSACLAASGNRLTVDKMDVKVSTQVQYGM